MPINVIIVEDEFYEAKLLNYFLNEIEDVSVLGIANDHETALEYILSLKPDIAFIDINLNGKPEFELLEQL